MNTRWFLNSDWWKYWSPILPALVRDMLLVGLDGSGHWVEEWKDANFNASCRGSMEEYWAKERITPEQYARAVERSSKAFRVAWDAAFAAPLILLGESVEGSKVEELLNAKFMEKGVWIGINQRIGDWALRFQLACAANPETTLESSSFVDDTQTGGQDALRTVSLQHPLLQWVADLRNCRESWNYAPSPFRSGKRSLSA